MTQKEITAGYRFHGIEKVSRLINAMPENFNIENIEYTLTANQVFEKRISVCIIRLETTIRTKNTLDVLAQFINVYGFELINLQTTGVDIETLNFILPENLVRDLIYIAMNTNRGLIFADLLGTYLQKGIFPVMNAAQLQLVAMNDKE
jgi:hypothetical protein